MAWWDFPITQPFGLPFEPQYGGHSGVDVGTPDNTPLSFPEGGRVIEADYKPWGGQIVIATGDGHVMGFLHVNSFAAKVGDTVKANQIVAYSGGGVGDRLLKNGRLQFATSQSDYAGYSTGYHTHFSVFQGKTVQDFAASLTSNVNRTDPTMYIYALKAGKPLESLASGEGNRSTANDTAGKSLFDFSGWGQKIGIFLIAVLLVLAGFFFLFQKQAVGAIKTAAKVAAL